MSAPPLVEARGLTKSFVSGAGLFARGARVRAVDGVDLRIDAGEIVSLVGESGSGKSTTGRLLVRLIEPDAGAIRFEGRDLLALRGRELREARRDFQLVFQDPFGSLNPRMRIGDIVAEPLVIHGIGDGRADREARTRDLLEQVGIDPAVARRFPHEFSGGQRQRIGIARAIACSPKFVVADEPVSALDPSVQAQIVNLMLDLRERLGLAYLFIAHDLELVRHISDRVAVMYCGRIVEEAPASELFAGALHPYTQGLLASTPSRTPGASAAETVPGEPPSATAVPRGCPFHPRCPVAIPECSTVVPEALPAADGHRVACHRVHPPG